MYIRLYLYTHFHIKPHFTDYPPEQVKRLDILDLIYACHEFKNLFYLKAYVEMLDIRAVDKYILCLHMNLFTKINYSLINALTG